MIFGRSKALIIRQTSEAEFLGEKEVSAYFFPVFASCLAFFALFFFSRDGMCKFTIVMLAFEA
jgi:hypothetical protein